MDPLSVYHFLKDKNLSKFLKFSFWELKAQLLALVCGQLNYFAHLEDDSQFEDFKNECLEILYSTFSIFENKLILRSAFKVTF